MSSSSNQKTIFSSAYLYRNNFLRSDRNKSAVQYNRLNQQKQFTMSGSQLSEKPLIETSAKRLRDNKSFIKIENSES